MAAASSKVALVLDSGLLVMRLGGWTCANGKISKMLAETVDID